MQYAWDRHDRFSVLGALSLAPWALRIGLYFRLFDHNITAADLVEFIKQLHRQLGRRLILVWDRWSVHRSAAKQLAHYDWLQVAYLPAYVPELNPVETSLEPYQVRRPGKLRTHRCCPPSPIDRRIFKTPPVRHTAQVLMLAACQTRLKAHS